MILKLKFLGEKDKESQKWSALDEFSKPENAKFDLKSNFLEP